MLRSLAVLALVSVFVSSAFAQAPPKLTPIKPADPTQPPPPPPPPPVPVPVPGDPAPPPFPTAVMPPMSGLSIVKVTLQDDGIHTQDTVMVPVVKTVLVEKVVNGEKVTEEVAVTQMVTEMRERVTKLSDLTVTSTDGKEVDADDLKEKLKVGGMVVMHFGKLGADERKLFKDGTLFFQRKPPKFPGRVPAPVPVPVPVPVAPPKPMIIK